MTFVPNSQVKLCSVPFSDYTNVLSFGTDDTKRYNYFLDKTIYNLTPDAGYSYVKGTGAIRVNKNKESLYNINYMIYRNTNFSGSKWFYAFVDSIEYINANCTEIRFSIDVWQTWESALNFHESFIVRQHIPKSQDTIGANLQPEGFTNLKYVEEKTKTTDLIKLDISDKSLVTIICCSEYPDGDIWRNYPSGIIDDTIGTLYYIPFLHDKPFLTMLKKFVDDGKTRSIVNIYSVPIESFYDQTSQTFEIKDGTPLSVAPNATFQDVWETHWVEYRIPKLEKINIGTHGTTINYTPNNAKMLTFPFTKVILTNNSGGSLTYRQEFFDGTKTEGNDIVFNVRNTVLQPVTSYCHPANYREGDYINGLTLSNFPMLPWVTNTYSEWLALNQHSLRYQQLTPIINGVITQGTNTINSFTRGARDLFNFGGGILTGDTGALNRAVGNQISNIGKDFTDTINNLWSTGEKIWSFYAKKSDMELQPNYSQGSVNANNILQTQQKLNFSVMFQRVCYEQFKQIDNYFDKFGYAINDFKQVNYNNRSNFDYIETSQVLIDGDVPEDDLNVIKSIFNNGVRIWHKPDTFLNFSVANN